MSRLLKIIRHFGLKNQIKKFAEEAFELQEALTVYSSNEFNEKNLNQEHALREEDRQHVVEELSDCLVLINQFAAYFNITDGELMDMMSSKIARTLNRIDDENSRAD